MFNTLSYTKKLEEAGILRPHAEAHVQVLADIMENDIATKNDLRIFEERLNGKFSDLKVEVKNDMAQLEYRMIIKLGAIVTIALAAMSALSKFINH